MVTLPEAEIALKKLRVATVKALQDARARNDQSSANASKELLGEIDDALDDLAISDLQGLASKLAQLRAKLEAATRNAKAWPLDNLAGLNIATEKREFTAMPMFTGSGRALDSKTFGGAAEMLSVDAAKLWAVVEIEAKRCGFLPDRRPVILFERHKFHEKTKGKHSREHSEISNEEAGGYGAAGAHQYDRLAKAIKLDREGAIWSTSWGLGQVMGFNAEAAGFSDMETMVQEMCASENAQLTGMVRFILKNGLDQALRVGDWTTFARKYNGKNYHINNYDNRLRGAHQKFSTGPLPDLEIREVQLLLTYGGFDPGLVDGWFGANTKRALNSFRAKAGLPETDELTSADLDRLRKEAYP